jgi:hypothetical protein
LTVDPARDTFFICPVCYPQSIAVFVGIVGKKLGAVPDRSARKTARIQAEQNNEIFPIEYPKNAEKILEIVKKRPVENQNWTPGETLAFLRQENKDNGI